MAFLNLEKVAEEVFMGDEFDRGNVTLQNFSNNAKIDVTDACNMAVLNNFM